MEDEELVLEDLEPLYEQQSDSGEDRLIRAVSRIGRGTKMDVPQSQAHYTLGT